MRDALPMAEMELSSLQLGIFPGHGAELTLIPATRQRRLPKAHPTGTAQLAGYALTA
jgi:hypothetical protein